jgi:glutamate-1-semialdehyde 2,1-aminomutase
MSTHEKSKELYERACRVLSGGVASEFRKFSTPHPLFYRRGKGSRLWDVDGNEYLDFTLSQGPLVLGHSHPEVLAAVAEASQEGQLYAGQHLQELELAELLQRLIPCAERMRFSLSGSEADHAALRLARAVTGRPKFLRFEGHYHGWFDSVSWSVGGTLPDLGPREEPTPVPWSQGLPTDSRHEFLVLPWNDLDLVKRVFSRHANDLAAVITEPVMCNNGCVPPQSGFLQGLRDLCDRHGTLLIFDEVITGFRTALGGAQHHFAITPDLAVFGKAMASGYPISVLAGKERFMRWIAEGKVIHAGTMNSGNPSVAAALKTVQILERDGIPDALRRKGERLMSGLRDASLRAGKPLLIQGLGPMFHVGFSPLPAVRDYRETLSYDKGAYARFVAGMHERGIRLIGRGLWYVSAAHSDADLERAISAAFDVLRDM